MTRGRLPTDKCDLCGHANSMHNSLDYCRSRTSRDGSGECPCDGTGRHIDLRSAVPDSTKEGTNTPAGEPR